MNVRRDYFNSIALMKEIATSRVAIDGAHIGDEDPQIHNRKASIVRNGLVVSSFNNLEGFLEDRMEEIIPCLKASKVRYASFDDRLKKFLTLDALEGLLNRTNFLPKPQRLAHVEANLALLPRFSSSRPNYVSYGFSSTGSNVKEDHITALLSALGLSGGWELLQKICIGIGAGGASSVDRFKNFAADRNKAAHDNQAVITSSILESHLETASTISVAIDLVCSYAVDCYKHSNDFDIVKSKLSDCGSTRSWSELIQDGHTFIEYRGGDVINRFANINQARQGIVRRKQTSYVVRKDARGLPIELIGSGVGSTG